MPQGRTVPGPSHPALIASWMAGSRVLQCLLPALRSIKFALQTHKASPLSLLDALGARTMVAATEEKPAGQAKPLKKGAEVRQLWAVCAIWGT